MKFSSTARKLIKKASDTGLDEGIVKTYLYAKANGFPLDYFPEDYQLPIAKSNIQVDTVDNDYMKMWVAMWPTPGQMRNDGANVQYSVSGNLPECRKRMAKFIKYWDELVEEQGDKYDIIWRATELYLQRQQDRGWAYTKKNHKFIWDNDGSTLAAMIQELGHDVPVNNYI